MQIFGPLSNNQAFPRVYLFIIQSLSSIFNYHVLALRILPFIFMLAAFFIWLKLFEKEEGRGKEYLLFLLTWCGSSLMTYYAAEFKQYSAEIFAGAIFTYVLLKQKDNLSCPNFRPLLSLQYFTLPLLVFFSYTAYFFVPLIAYNLLLGSRKNRTNLQYLFIYLFSVALFILIMFNIDIKHARGDQSLLDFWDSYCISVTSFYEFSKTFWEGIRNLFVRFFNEERYFRRIMTVFVLPGFFYLILAGIKKIKDDRGLLISLKSIALALFGGLFLAGVLKFFPFTGARITLFFAPFIFYTVIKSITFFKEKIKVVYYILFLIYACSLLFNAGHQLLAYFKQLLA